MQVLDPRCAGLDVHRDTVLACVRCVSAPQHHEVRRSDTTTKGLLALADGLGGHGCPHVAMEATGVDWKPVGPLLESGFERVMANAAPIRNLPGRKIDVNDAMWIIDVAHGLLRSGFVAPAAIQQLRDLTHTRKRRGPNPGAVPRKPSWPSPHPCSPPPTSCCVTASLPRSGSPSLRSP